MKEIYHAYEQGYIQAVEAIHDKIVELECDEMGRVSFIEVLSLVDGLIKKELLQ